MNIKKKYKILIIGIIIGSLLSGTVVYATSEILFQSSQVSFDNTRANLTKQNGDPVETVEEAIEALANGGGSGASACPSSPFQVGDYIDMTPSGAAFIPDSTYTNYTQTDQITPSELNLWRVIEINPDCTVEVVSEYVSSTNVYFKGKVGYQNYIYYLNEIAKKYANTTYTLDPSTAPDGAFRNVGYDGQTKQITDTTRLDDQTLGTESGAWYQKTTSMNGEESLGGGDQGYGTDVKLLDDAGVSLVAYKVSTTTPTDYWLASRLYTNSSTSSWYFNARYMYYSGSISSNNLVYWYRSGFTEIVINYAVRPVITLKSGLTTASGSGTSSSHYQLNAS